MVFLFLIIVFLVIVDQLTKYFIVGFFAFEGETFPIIQDFFHLTYTRNAGAVFGIGGNTDYALYFFIGVFMVAIAIFGVMFVKNDFRDRRRIIYTISLILLIAGSIGNTIDRIFQPDHKVVDFLDFRGIWSYIFNFADICLTVGITLFFIDQFLIEPKRVKAA